MHFLKKYPLVIILIIELFCSANVKWTDGRWRQIIDSDGKGYYGYLPAVFIYHDLQFAFYEDIQKKYYDPRIYSDYRVQTPGGLVNKYFVGTAIGQLPFFLLASVLTKIWGYDADGFSFFYQFMVSIAGLFYGMLGLFFLRKILRTYSFSENIIAIVLFIFAFGTHLFNYTVYEGCLSHVFSFACITGFIYCIRILLTNENKKYLYLSSVFLGMILLTRPINGLIIFSIPFLAGSSEKLKDLFRFIFKNSKVILLCLAMIVCFIFIQLFIYYLQTGSLLQYSYENQKIIWTRPEIINILFSYKKGLFVYTPAAFISLLGFFSLYNKKFMLISFIAFLLIISYVFSCWWVWWYGGSFSARPYVEYLGLFAILLCFLLTSLKSKAAKVITYSALSFCLILNLVQTYQYRYYIIHWERMDKEHYWRVFMRVDQIINQHNANKDLIEKYK